MKVLMIGSFNNSFLSQFKSMITDKNDGKYWKTNYPGNISGIK